VILEDAAAVTGVAVAASCMALTNLTGSPVPDALGSLVIGCLLGQQTYILIKISGNLCWNGLELQ